MSREPVDDSKRPLSGRTVLITRPRNQAEDLRAAFEELGACVEFQPAIEIVAPPDWAPVDAVLNELPSYDWAVFSSTNGVDFVARRMSELGTPIEALASVHLAAVGPGTARRLEELGLTVDLVPESFRAEGLAEALAPHVANRRVFLARASRGREVLAEALIEAGADVTQGVVYTSRDVATPDPRIERLLRDGHIDWVTVTSSAIAKSLARLLGDALRKSRLAAISPLTAEALTSEGFEAAITADSHDMAGMIRAIVKDAEGD